MTRLTTLVLSVIVAVPAGVLAQTAPPPPPPSPVRPVPVPTLPPLPPVPDVIAPPVIEWPDTLDALRVIGDLPRIDTLAVREALDQARASLHELPHLVAPMDLVPIPDLRLHLEDQEIRAVVTETRAGTYTSAMSALSARRYEDAIERFDKVVAEKGPQADAALYWKAFALFRLGRSDEALVSIAALRRDHSKSRYLNDARVLETDVKRLAGQPVNPAAIDDDEIRILAIQGLQRSSPEGAVPLLEGVLAATHSLRVKQQTLYVLALSDQPRAHTILMSYAKGAGNPDLQLQAIRYLVSRRDKETTGADLRAIYESTDDVHVRQAVISAFRSGSGTTWVVAPTPAGVESRAVRVETRIESRTASFVSAQDLWLLYQKEPNDDLRIQMLGAFSAMRATDYLVQAAKTEQSAAVRARAIRYLGGQEAASSGQALVDLYGQHADNDTRKAVISALSSQDNAEALVAIARKEKSLDLTRDIVSRLSSMAGRSKVAADYLMEIIRKD